MRSFLDNILDTISDIKEKKDEFLDTCNITYIDLDGHGAGWISLGGILKHWGDSSEKQLGIQIQLIEYFKRLDEKLKQIEYKMPIEKFKEINLAKNRVHNWINKKGDPPGLSVGTSKISFNEELERIKEFINQLRSESHEIVIIPDTNAIIRYPDPKDYFKVSNNEKFTFLILPTVLSELDNHKNFHKNPDFQKKVTSVIKRLKGYLKQGDVKTGVTIEKERITIKMVETEPKFENLPEWLDKENKDDRIIASVLTCQTNYLNSIIYLVTGDINMINKASLAGINSFDNDEIG